MGGIFGTISKKSCVADLFYGTDYNSHLGTRRGGMATYSEDKGFVRSIHNLESSYFRSKFESSLNKFEGCCSGIGVISDTDAQPLVMNSHLGAVCHLHGVQDCQHGAARGRDAQPQYALRRDVVGQDQYHRTCGAPHHPGQDIPRGHRESISSCQGLVHDAHPYHRRHHLCPRQLGAHPASSSARRMAPTP